MQKYDIAVNNSILLLIDVQNNLAKAMKEEVYKTIEKNIILLISSCRILNIPILLTEQYPRGLGPTVEAVRSNLGAHYQPVEKISFSCFDEPLFLDKLNRSAKKYVIVAGIEAHVCVLQTVLALVSNGYYVHIAGDAVCSRFKSDWKTALDYMRSCGGVVTTTEIAVFQLLKKAGTSEFKAISPLFRDK